MLADPNLRMSRLVTISILTAALLAAGCSGPRAQVQLIQPSAPPVQQNLQLKADWAYTAVEGDTRLCLLDFPLPQSRSGPRDFRFYLRMPATPGAHTINSGDAAGAAGFFVQVVGQRKGKSLFTGGTIEMQSAWNDRDRLTLRFDLTCDDGTQAVGTAKLIVDELELRAFRRKFAPDIAALNSQSAELTSDTEAAPAKGESENPVEAAEPSDTQSTDAPTTTD